MDLFKDFRDRLIGIVAALGESGDLPEGLDVSRIVVEPPRDPAHGDLSTNAAMVLAKPAGVPPRALAERLCELLSAEQGVETAEVAGPGFINLRLADSVWHGCLAAILVAGRDYGASRLGAGRRVNVEYVSANPTGPLHIGHARGTVFGDVLAALLEKTGHDVTREYYVNDAGNQVDSLAFATYWRYLEALGCEDGEGALRRVAPDRKIEYRGEYLIPVGQALAEDRGATLATIREGKIAARPVEDWLLPVRTFAVEAMMTLIREDLALLGVKHDVFTSERALVEAGKVEEALRTLEARGLIYTGVLAPPKGKKPEDWEPRPQTLFRATAFGDDVDRPLRKSDGSYTYFASDIAYHLDKFRRGFRELIDVWGADHGGYVKRMQAATQAVTENGAELDIKICQIVKLLDKGEPVKMSKRAGRFVTLRDLVDEVGRDVVRFIMLTRRNDAPLDFDLTTVREQSRDNPVFYVQYAHARCCSVERMARERMPSLDTSAEALRRANLARLTDESELALIKSLAHWPRTVEAAATTHEPHRLAYYLYDLASAFHTLWTRGSKEDATLRFIVEGDPDLTAARLALARGTQIVLATGLELMGVQPVEELR